jgi:hypothetical protein
VEWSPIVLEMRQKMVETETFRTGNAAKDGGKVANRTGKVAKDSGNENVS